MIELKHLDAIASRLSGVVSLSMHHSRAELHAVFKDVLQLGLAKLNLVTRDEFEIQRDILFSTREKVEELHQTLILLEERLINKRSN
ncbi:MAG TPA: accessory factor UbiK family protein [Xylella sp.]